MRLLAYFGEALGAVRQLRCLPGAAAVWDGTVAARKALSCVYRTGQRFGAAHLIDVLLGKDETEAAEVVVSERDILDGIVLRLLPG